MIKQVGDKWVLFTKDGSKRLGTHDSREDAEKQEAAIEASKARAAGGPGSGNFGHSGRPGQQGGSGEGDDDLLVRRKPRVTEPDEDFLVKRKPRVTEPEPDLLVKRKPRITEPEPDLLVKRQPRWEPEPDEDLLVKRKPKVTEPEEDLLVRRKSRIKASSAEDQESYFRSLLDQLDPAVLRAAADIPTDDKEDHPFTYCMNHVVPAIEKKQGAMDDPKAFCGWWKAEREFTAAEAAFIESVMRTLNFAESDHPRADDGKFTESSGGGGEKKLSLRERITEKVKSGIKKVKESAHAYVESERARRAEQEKEEAKAKDSPENRKLREDVAEHFRRKGIRGAADTDGTIRQVHLIGATGQIRTATYDNREHLVVPVVALMEGVIHAINAETPEFVPLTCLSVAPQGWDGRPVVLGHPVKNGRQISANAPGVLEAQAFGHVFGSRIEGKKLMLEAWIDPVKAIKVGAQDLLNNIRTGRMCEVSVGAFVVTDAATGMFGDKPYKAVWRDIVPDHLAFLPKGIGACSIEMGCGSPRAAMAHMVTEAELVVLAPLPDKSETDTEECDDKKEKCEEKKNNDKKELPAFLKKTRAGAKKKVRVSAAYADPNDCDDPDECDEYADQAEDDGDDETAMLFRKRAKKLRFGQRKPKLRAAQYGDTPEQAKAEEDAELVCYNTLRQLLDQVSETLDGASEIVDALIADETENPTETSVAEESEEEIEQARMDSLQVLTMSMYSSLNAVSSLIASHQRGYDNGTEAQGRYMAGARHSATDRDIIQKVHDHTVDLGADCPGKQRYAESADAPAAAEPVTAAETPCGCKGEPMTKEQRDETIRTLVADKHSGFTAGDEKMLEAASDERLESFRVAATARAKEVEKQNEKPQPTTAAAAPTLTEDDFLKLAPESLRSLISRQQAQDIAHKAQLVADLKAAQQEYSESELSAMPLEGLERLARIAGVKAEPPAMSYAGRPIPRVAESKDTNVFTNPPDPYEAGLKAMRGQTIQ